MLEGVAGLAARHVPHGRAQALGLLAGAYQVARCLVLCVVVVAIAHTALARRLSQVSGVAEERRVDDARREARQGGRLVRARLRHAHGQSRLSAGGGECLIGGIGRIGRGGGRQQRVKQDQREAHRLQQRHDLAAPLPGRLLQPGELDRFHRPLHLPPPAPGRLQVLHRMGQAQQPGGANHHRRLVIAVVVVVAAIACSHMCHHILIAYRQQQQ